MKTTARKQQRRYAAKVRFRPFSTAAAKRFRSRWIPGRSNSYIVDLEIDGKTEKAVLRDVQFHPIREEILHMDFYRVQPGKPVAISIPVRLTGNAEGVKIGGKLVLSPAS